MKQWWLNLAARERRVVLIGGLAVFFAILYWGGWHPLQLHLQQSRTQVQQLRQQLNWMREQAPLVNQLTQTNHADAPTNIDIASALTASSQTQQLVLKRIQPQGENAQVELETIDFAQLLAWLDLLEQQYGITPQQIELQSLPQLPGKVQVKRLLLGRNKK
ncbi:MAG: type II secretion system protein M [Tolumonas sp.]|uniref:type II secretion system protein M n=1 Tax=uncultured Tolumonas sp. TaxID=263765 RepID=UPI002A0A56DA|nr:type II secretion system protein M [uncultured Tolumonas sp.]MDD2342142.1 type II secretion system protein M [Tolumonas sp.]